MAKLEEMASDPVINLALNTISINKQALIFANTKRSAEKTAEEISKKVKGVSLNELSEKVLKALSKPTKQCERLSKCIEKGIAFHHAGLCLPYETEIILSNGETKKIGEVVEEFRNGTKFDILSLNPITLKIRKESISDVFAMNFNERLVKIKTRLGKKLILTKNHPLLTINEEGNLEWVKSKNLKKGDFIATAREICIKGSVPHFIDLLNKEKIYVHNARKILDKYIKKLKRYSSSNAKEKKYENIKSTNNLKLKNVIYINNKLNKKYKLKNIVKEIHWKGSQNKIKIPEKITEEFLRFVGFIVADGSIGKQGSIALECSDKSIINEITETIKNSFDIDPCVIAVNKDEGFKKAYKVLVNSRIISDLLVSHFGLHYGKKSDKVFVSPLIKNLSNPYISSYLSGLFDCDGAICISREKLCFEYNTASEELAEDIVYLLLRLGIYSYKSKKNVKGKITKIRGHSIKSNFNLNRVFIYGVDSLDKMLRLGLIKLERKRNKLKNALKNRDKKNQIDVIPNLGTLLNKNRKKKNLSFHKLGKKFPLTTIWRLEKNKNPIKREFLQRIGNFFNDNQIRTIASSDILWDRIEDMEYTNKKKVYDISVNPTQNFIIKNGVICHNTHKQKELIEDNFRDGVVKIICATTSLAYGVDLPAFRAILKDLKRYTHYGYSWIPVLEAQQMFGRAGRPNYDKEGQAICIAATEAEKKKIHERYILGKPEEIYSKLAVEPVLRTYLLSLIAADFVHTKKQIIDFFKKTFWAFQFGDISRLRIIIERMLELLEEWEFIISDSGDFKDASELNDENYRATRIGKRVAELCIDPLTAYFILICIRKAASKRLLPFSFLQMISHTLEMRPLLRVRNKEYDKVQEALLKYGGFLLEEEPSMYDPEYEDFLNSIKTALMFNDWINEKDEDFLLGEYNIRPGELNVKLELADWLLYGAEELTRMLHFQSLLKEILRLRLRLKHGVKEELLPLIRLENIGRVRARKLYFNNIRDIAAVKKADLMKLTQILGKNVALGVKKQVGEEIKEIKTGKRKGQISLEDY